MKKRIFSLLLCLILLLTACAPAVTGEPPEKTAEPAIRFTAVKIPFPDRENYGWDEYSRMVLRYADTGERIPLSMYYDGHFWATVPEENAERAMEVYTPDEITFPDYDDDIWQYYTMEQAVYCGLMLPDENGNAAPMEEMTRKDAVETVLRFLGISADDAVAKAAELGLTAGIPDFAPEAAISRQEFTVLAMRALDLAGLTTLEEATREEVAAIWPLHDAENIADWALNAYGAIGTGCFVDFLETDKLDEYGVPIYENYALPEQTVLRWEAAQLLDRLRSEYQVYPSQTAIEYGFDKAMPVIDGSTSTLPFTNAVYNNLFNNGYHHPQKPEKHSKSHASYQRLINGEVDMIFASVYPASDILKMAQDAGVELELIPIAYDAMVFFTNAENPIEGLTIQQISDIYVSDAYDNWSEVGGPDALLYPYCRNNDSGSHAQMERHFLNGNPIHENIIPETSMTMSDILTDVMSAQTDDPKGYALGYSIYYYFNNMDMFYGTLSELKLLEIDGVAPTDETIASGEYPLSNNTYIALRKDTPEDHPARKMARFMLTELGQQCVIQAGFGPLDPSVKLY